MNEIKIRLGYKKDAETIANFNILMAMETEHKKLPKNIITAGVKKILSNSQYGFYLIAEKNNQIAGSLMVTKEWSDWRNGEFWWIQSVFIKTEFRRQGIYKKLYAFVKSKAQKNPDVCGFRLYVEEENSIAMQTYESCGMIKTHYKMYEEEIKK